MTSRLSAASPAGKPLKIPKDEFIEKSHDTNRITIIVGKEKKRYIVSRSFLRYYSTLLNAMILPGESVIELPRDKIEYWEILYEFVIRGGLHDGSVDFKGDCGQVLRECMDFLNYAAKYGNARHRL
ncbi:hypothetical protein GLAREA_04415 [Glarea lozoyensis ATCC 20868]|uniref:BTB domain-containing protein n=1 Tax=Glarea lozoyensis (strain ATCC 20868 / MF5171) TaxID=1116229 RepID=S3CR92_GLAL2|nr:uncharacterized protein GLAREA_04415 [Glarea lozoyensis ATCC 20868]EPE27624.1 hypothetical protein GLAREA_04415 [Glarea lozoyensis ATCC 20868]